MLGQMKIWEGNRMLMVMRVSVYTINASLKQGENMVIAVVQILF